MTCTQMTRFRTDAPDAPAIAAIRDPRELATDGGGDRTAEL